MSLCESCHAGCCRSFAVPATGADILRIEQELDLSFWDFACRWADPKGEIARNHAPQFHFPDDPETPFVICLTHTSSRIFKETSQCRFLVECPPDENHPLGQAKCGVYNQRPAACRAFPAKLNETGELAVLYDVPEHGRPGSSNPLYNLCSRNWEPEDVHPLKTVQELVVARYEMNFFHNIAQIWNNNPGPWANFPEFLHLVYAGRVIRDSTPAIIAFPPQKTSSEHSDAERVLKAA